MNFIVFILYKLFRLFGNLNWISDRKNLTKDFCFSCSLFTALSIQNSYVATLTGHFAGHISYKGRIVFKSNEYG